MIALNEQTKSPRLKFNYDCVVLLYSVSQWSKIKIVTNHSTDCNLSLLHSKWIFLGFVRYSAATLIMMSSKGSIFRVTGHLCGEFTGDFPAQRPVTRSFDVFFDLRLNKRLSKQSWGWWFETLSHPLWRHRNADIRPNGSVIHKTIHGSPGRRGVVSLLCIYIFFKLYVCPCGDICSIVLYCAVL